MVVLTRPAFVGSESADIRRMLESGWVDRVHLRKPGSSEEDMRRLIEDLPEDLYSRLTLHDHFPLAAEMGLGGVHLNSRCHEVPAGFPGLVSASCHSFEELDERRGCDYRFLSPVYDSISKEGYRSAFSEDDLRGHVDRGVYALGGVTPRHLPSLQGLGFGGAAMLGSAWRQDINDFIKELQCYNS